MNEAKKNEMEYVTKNEFKKTTRTINFKIIAIAVCVMYMFFR